jgi:hypothetical protein
VDNNQFISIVSCIFVFLFSLPVNAAERLPLEWINETNAEQSFLVDRDAGRLRFYVTYGYSSRIPAIGRINYKRCYGKAKLTHLTDMSDQPNNMKEKLLFDKAAIFAEEYNKLMRTYLDEQGLRTCDKDVDWDEMERKLFIFASGSTQVEGSVKAYGAGEPRISIKLKDISRADEVTRFACENLKQHGINEKVEITLYEWLYEQKHKMVEKEQFNCSDGIKVTE